jgi:chitinase
VPTSYALCALSLATPDPASRGAVTFGVDSGLSSALGGYTDAQFTADVATLHSRGQQVILSVGGQNGTISVGDSTAAANFANSVFGLMQRFGFDGVDIDLENGVSPSAMGSALRQLSGKAGSGLIITLAPQTLDMQSTGMAYFQLALGIKDILTIVNTQYYNSGSMNGCDGNVYSQGSVDFITALACIQLQGGLRPDQVGLGLPASTQAAGSGHVDPSVVNRALDCLTAGANCGTFHPPATWPSLRGAMTWSINWDASNGFAFANAVRPHLAGLP